MKIKLSTIMSVFLFICSGSIYGSFVENLVKQTSQKLRPVDFFVGIRQEKENLLVKLRQEKQDLQESQALIIAAIKEQVDEVTAKIVVVKNELKAVPDDDLLNKKLSIFNETNQTLQDILGVRDQLNTLLNESIKLIDGFLQDTDFSAYKKENKLHERLYYSFEDLQKLHEMILDQEKRVANFAEQEKSTRAELEVRKQSSAAMLALFKKKEEELQSSAGIAAPEEMNFEVEQNTELLRAQEKLYTYKKMLNELLLQEAERKIDFLSMQLYIEKTELDILKTYLRKIKPSIRISEADIVYANDAFVKWKQEYYSAKELYRKQVEVLRDKQKKVVERLNQMSQKYTVPISRELDEWTKEPAQAVEPYVHFVEIATLNTENLLLTKKIKLLEAQISLEDEELNYETISFQVKQSYHNIVSRKLTSDEEVAREVKQYEVPKTEAKAREMRYAEKTASTVESLTAQKKVLDNIVQHRKELEKLSNTIFKAHQKEYARCIKLFTQAEKYVKDEIDVLSKTSGVYSGIISTITRINRLISFIKSELESITIWYRPEYAVTWQGFKNIMPDITTFFLDIRSYITRFDIKSFVWVLKDSLGTSYQIFLFLFKLLALFIVFLVARAFMPRVSVWLLRISKEYAGLARFISLLLILFFSFVRTHFVSIVAWSMFFAFLQFTLIQDQYLYVIFYLLSIPYLLYLAHRFIKVLVGFNREHEYALFAQDFQRRFVWVLSTFLYATVIILFFREAFMLANYYQSEVPIILKAINYIIFQISLIFLLTKEQIVNFIPSHNEFWRWVGEQVDYYYYLILFIFVGIIVMSNPYVGFGRLVLHVFFNLLYSGLLIVGLYWFYTLFKRVISRMFFSIEQDATRERFSNAKTCFGLLIISSFIIVTFLGVLLSAKIWGWQINVKDMVALLYEPFLGRGTANPVSVMSLVHIVAFIIGGFILSYMLDSFVLDKIFDLLLVDQGVQHTVTSIMRYIVVTMAVFIGFINQGLGELVSYIVAAMALSIGWVLKDPIMDFVSYFIILVQRPIKIGDYIQLDPETSGVVRKITARAVVLRRKNSTTIMVPNSLVSSRKLVNWNYTRSFIAFNDIHITIDYSADPVRAKEILTEVVMSHPNILKNPPVTVRLDKFRDIGYEFMVRGHISSVYTLEQWNIASDVRLAIVKALRENNIEIAVPVRVIKTVRHMSEKVVTGDDNELGKFE